MGKTYKKNDWQKKARKDRQFKKSKKFKDWNDGSSKKEILPPIELEDNGNFIDNF